MKASCLTFMPACVAISFKRIIWPVVMPAKPLTLMARTTPPLSNVLRKILKPLVAKTSAMSTISLP